MKFLTFLLLLSFSLGGLGGFAQRLPYTFERMRVSENSLENQISCILKDRNGYLWLGTASGLKRYDAHFSATFKFKRNDSKSLVSNNIESICEDKLGRLWVGTTEGVCYLDKSKNSFVRFKELNKPDYACINIICDSRGDVWFTIRDKGLFRFVTKTNQLQNFSHDDTDPQSLSYNRILRKGLVEDPNKSGIWIVCEGQLNFFDFKTQKINNQAFNPKSIPILSLLNISALTVHQNQLVYADNNTNEMVWYDTKQHKQAKSLKLKNAKGQPIYDIYQFFFDANHDIWVSSYYNTMVYINNKTNESIDINYEKENDNSFSAHHFLDAFQEKNGTLWFATLNGISTVNGLLALNPTHKLIDEFNFSRTFFKNHPNDALMHLHEDTKDSTWWLITSKNRLIHYFPRTDTFKEIKIPSTKSEDGNQNVPLELYQYQNKLFIFKLYTGFVFDKEIKQFSEFRYPKSFDIKQNTELTLVTIRGDSLWMFGKNIREGYNYHLAKKTWKKIPLVLNLFDKIKASKRGFAPSHFLTTHSGDLWIAIHSGGLAKFSKEKQAFISQKTKQPIDFTKVGYVGFSEDKNGKFWLGSYDLIKFDPLTTDFQTVLDRDLIGSSTIDKNDNLYLSAHDELVVYQEKNNDTYTFNLQNESPFSDWANRLLNLSNNKIIVLKKQGLALVDFRNLKIPSFKDQIYINRIANTDSGVLIHENNSQVYFDSKQNSFSIYYGMLTLPNAGLYQFSYQLEGVDKEWIADKEGRRTAIYGQLSGGDYVFKVRAMDTNRRYLPTQYLYIHIHTPFYKTWWFMILLGMVAVGVIFYFIRYRATQRNKIHHLQIQSTRLEKDKTEIQYQNLINHLNPHFLFNSLTSLNGLILSEPEVASDFLQKLSKIYRYILQNKENEVVRLDQELGFVKNYVDLQKSRFEDGLQVNIAIDDEYLSSGIVPVTLQNLFENAIKHNTIEEDKPLVISVFVEDETLIVKNNSQKKKFVETSNKQGLDSLKSLYKYLTPRPLEIVETETEFIVRVPLL